MLAGLKIRYLISVVLLWMGLCSVSYAVNKIEGIRVWPAPENTRIVFDLKQKPDYSYFSLSGPQRLVIDFKNSQNTVLLNTLAAKDKRIKRFRTSESKKKGSTRLVLELAKSYQLTVFPLAPAGQYGHRLVVDLHDKESKKRVVKAVGDKKRDIIIGIDAGHGGEDPGSIGGYGTYEKQVTLAIAKRLQNLINKQKGFKAVMTRTGDYYVHLNRRTQIARQNQVDFLISIHADAFRTPQPNGASVWVALHSRVESELSRWLVNREKNSELLGGGGGVIKNTADDNLAITLADMNKEHSLEMSLGLASDVISKLKKVTKLHKKTPQHASLAVLKASDIPSILVETGFISNHKEEKNLKTAAFQQKLARAISNGVRQYFLQNPPKDSYLASVGFTRHKVSSGESLSLLAQRYRVSVGQLKSANNLTSNVVRIGQTLKIPRAD
ncbi:N-acetylmuramoyl-L-alanine amidase [Thalassomonas sp. RHCl1]|uniref:N-acetylmuramoyl-L-alanine amidase n=1 Tax=Thalassomonas sp. RHCl1 TaxID=2995320 RepID=UPI00248D0536|nr:N-acetylmuramoyl-L-alanine amidase [Thalassomonas sp. RHCl1]